MTVKNVGPKSTFEVLESGEKNVKKEKKGEKLISPDVKVETTKSFVEAQQTPNVGVPLSSAQQTQAVYPVRAPFVGLEPASVWRYFSDITRIPRKSGNEAGIRDYIKNFAIARDIPFEIDEVGNILLRVNKDQSGTPVALQAHLDMVCVNEQDTQIDFAKDPIPVERNGNEITAKGTSLGADNGIGIAYALALADEAQGPLELLFTIDEEDGFTGVEGVKPGWLEAKQLVNLDSEEEGFVTIACAGGRDLLVDLPIEREASAGQPVEIAISGLKGGHSGVDIGLERSNAIKLMGAILEEVAQQGGQLIHIDGGQARNAIPYECNATVSIAAEKLPALQKAIARVQNDRAKSEDDGLTIACKETQCTDAAMSKASFERVNGLIGDLPHGVLQASKSDPTQPFLSNNLAVIKDDAATLSVTSMCRSPSDADLDTLEKSAGAIAQRHGAKFRTDNGYSGWAPNYDSPLLAEFQKVHREVCGKEAVVLEIHAGLECGELIQKYPGLDAISVGPDIVQPHSTGETVSVDSVARNFKLVQALVARLRS